MQHFPGCVTGLCATQVSETVQFSWSVPGRVDELVFFHSPAFLRLYDTAAGKPASDLSLPLSRCMSL